MGDQGIFQRLRGLRALVLGACVAAGFAGVDPASPPGAMEPGRPHFRAFSPRDGLPQGTVMALAFDRRGALWVGTQDGAAWYDGRIWNVVDMPDRAVSNYVEAICPAADGSIWFGRQDGGLAQLKQGIWRTFTQKDGLPADRVTSLVELRDARGHSVLWVGTYGGGLARLVDGRWEIIDRKRGLLDDRIWKLVPRATPEGGEELWVCGESGMLARVDARGQVQAYPGLPSRSINNVLETTDAAGQSELWITTFGAGIGHFSGGRWRFTTTHEGLPSDFTTDVAETRSLSGKRVLWFSTVAGLVRSEEGVLRTFNVQWGLPSDTVYRLRRDPYRPDALWIGTLGGGLLYFQEGSWLTHDAPAGLPSNYIAALALGRSRHGEPSILAGTSVGLARYEAGQWRRMEMPSYLKATRVTSLLEEQGSGALWVGTLAGLSRMEGGQWTQLGAQQGLPHAAVACLLETQDEQGGARLWVGTMGGGLACREGSRWRIHNVKSGLPSDSILALCETQEQGRSALWVGFRGGGLGRLREGRWEFWNRGRGLPNNIVSTIHASRGPGGSPELWIGTVGGGVAWTSLAAPDLEWNVISSSTSPPLPSDTVHQIQEDAAGGLYLSTNRGVLRLARVGGGYTLEQFTEDDGLPSDQCSPTASLIDHQGHVWIGTAMGLGELDPRLPVPLELAHPLVLREVSVGEKARQLPDRGALVLHPGERDVAIDFALLSYRKEDTHQFRTFLSGRDAGPSGWGLQRRREFTNLSPGAYRFQVWAKEWSGLERGPLELEIVVQPSFWETWWFRTLSVLLLAGVVAAVLRWQLRAVVRRTNRLKRLVQQQTQELEQTNEKLRLEIDDRIAAEQVKDEFVSVVSHELRTPLTSIRGALGLLEGGAVEPLSPEVNRLVGVAHGNVLRLQVLVNDLLDVQKLGSGEVRLNLQVGSMKELVKAVLAANEGLSRTTGVAFRLIEPCEDALVTMDADRIEQVLTNLLSNGAKYCPHGLPVEVRIQPKAEQVRVSVTNRGLPIPDEFRSRIFAKFAQADSSAARSKGGTGLGLAISRTLIELHGGRIDYESDAQATTFWFELPR